MRIKKRGFAMATSDQMEKYLNKKGKYKEVETMDKVYAKSLDKSKMLIRDSEDGSGTGQGIPNRKGTKSFMVCPHCGKNIDLRR